MLGSSLESQVWNYGFWWFIWYFCYYGDFCLIFVLLLDLLRFYCSLVGLLCIALELDLCFWCWDWCTTCKWFIWWWWSLDCFCRFLTSYYLSTYLLFYCGSSLCLFIIVGVFCMIVIMYYSFGNMSVNKVVIMLR